MRESPEMEVWILERAREKGKEKWREERVAPTWATAGRAAPPNLPWVSMDVRVGDLNWGVNI